jgi:phosphatidylglycerophosphate synthase
MSRDGHDHRAERASAGRPAPYRVEDRSILLPHYKRLFVEPCLPLLPAGLDPNHITHVGHLLALTALLGAFAAQGTSSPWPFLAVALLVNLYNWCDNVDGSHARRVGRCSALGEYLDHGLDLLSATYVVGITALALGAPPFWTLAAVVLVPMAAAFTYWEQAETGTMQLGLLNQVESVACLTVILVLRAALGPALGDVAVGPIPLAVLLLGVVVSTAAVTILGSLMRVGAHGGRLLMAVPPLAFLAALLVAVATGALGELAGVVAGTSVMGFHGIRQLGLRVAGRRSRFETGVLVSALVVAGITCFHHLVAPVAGADFIVAFGAAVPFGLLALVKAVEGRRAVGRTDRTRISG